MKTLFTDVIPYLFGSGAVLLFILSWIRFRKKDAGTVTKLQADAAKINAEAMEIKAKADVLITDGALRIVDRLSKDLDDAREEIEKLIVIAAQLKELHEKSKLIHAEETKGLLDKLKEAKDLMDLKKRHCIETKDRIIKLHELLLIKQTGLTQEQLQVFVDKLIELINSGYDERNTQTPLL